MNHPFRRGCFVAALILAALASPIWAAEAPVKSLISASADGAEKRIAATSMQVTVSRSTDDKAPGVVVAIRPGKDGYPGISISPEGAAWDLSAFGHIEARVANTGSKQITVCLRVDNAGDWTQAPWNGENLYLKPGASGTVRVRFGYSWGKRAYALKPAAVIKVMLFTTKSDAEQSFRIESVEAGGTPGEAPAVDPQAIRVKPRGGVLLGAGVTIDAATQIQSHGAQASLLTEGDSPALHVVFPAKGGEAALKPAVGRWDLRDCLEIRARVRNDAASPVTPRVRVESNGGPSEWAVAASPLGAGAEVEIAVPFIAATVWNGQKEHGNRVTNDAVSAVTISATSADGERSLRVVSIRAGMPAAPELPAWIGTRPPVEGEWDKTFDEEFDGAAIDAAKWNIRGENYWDKKSHFSKDDVILGGGVVKLRFEKKRGHHNDDPKRAESDYAAGYLDTYGKWTQRYGYFEARMKPPTAPGLWPAFWSMPDRGKDSVPPGKRGSTGDGAMEFDIMEHLTRWGPNRYNIAMHWDGYGKEHKSTGTENVYVQADKDGFITSGLLWTPGSAVYYCNGREVARWDSPRVSSVPGDMMFTLPMGGWDNNDLDDARLPEDFTIDYVRVWQRKGLAGLPDQNPPPAK